MVAKVFCLLAATGFVLSAVVHFSTFVGVDPQQICPSVFMLHLGIFVVFIPAVFAAKQMEKKRGKNKSLAKEFPHAPRWMTVLVSACFLYALMNFGIFIWLMDEGSPNRRNQEYVLENRGDFVREITEREFHRYRAYEVRGFSGHWMLFYCVSMTMHYSSIQTQKIEDGKTGAVPPEARRPAWVAIRRHGWWSMAISFVAAVLHWTARQYSLCAVYLALLIASSFAHRITKKTVALNPGWPGYLLVTFIVVATCMVVWAIALHLTA